MSQSPLARKRKSLSAFSRAPSQLSRSHSALQLEGADSDSSPSKKPSSSSSQNAFATPSREPKEPRRSRRESERFDTPTKFRSGGAGPDFDSPGSTAPLGTPGGTPRRIIYSPYATPPAGPSRSSIAPFDMAASAAAAKQTNERLRAVAASGGAGTPAKKQRFVRRKPLWQRILDAPGNALDDAMFNLPSSVDEILPPERFANPIAIALFAIHWVLLAPLRNPIDDDLSIFKSSSGPSVEEIGSRWQRYEISNRVGLAGWRTTLLVTVLLFALSAANTAWLFTRFRTYDMQLRSGKNPVNSPHASPVPAPKASDVTEDRLTERDEAPVQKYGKLVAHGLWVLVKWTYRALLSAIGVPPLPDHPSTTSSGASIQSLRVWDPPEFCLAFFTAMPPTAPVLSYLLTAKHPFLTPLIHVGTALLLSTLSTYYAQLVKDRMILSSEVMREYDQRFVYKRVFAPMVDRGVGTSDAVMLP